MASNSVKGFSLFSGTSLTNIMQNNNNSQPDINTTLNENVVLCGSLRKLKTMKKKYFVLYRHSTNQPARLDYFDSEKKYRLHAGHPKRSINLESCFNINRKTDTKHKYVIALYTNEDCFGIVCESEKELEQWLHKMLYLQNNKDENGEMPKPTFAHVWSVEVQRRGLAQEKGLLGRYHLCLTEKTITLNRFGNASSHDETRLASVEFPMSTVRKGGHLNCVFYMELGRQNVLGAGELWVEAQDSHTAQNIHHSIINASSKPSRPRSQSASHATKPITVITRRSAQQSENRDNPTINFSPPTASSVLTGFSVGMPIKRDRCDSLPSRNRTISDGNVCSLPSPSSSIMPPPKTIPSWSRPASMCNRPPSNSPICSESEGSSISIDEPDGLPYLSTPDDTGPFIHRYPGPHGNAILEESDEYWSNEKQTRRDLIPVRPISSASLSLSINKNAGPMKITTGLGNPSQNSPADVHGAYMEMYSPSESSPGDPTGNGSYMPMSPSVDVPRSLYTGSSSAHSRASSLTEEHLDSQYVDMDMSHNQSHDHHNRRGVHRDGGMSSAASTSSITSGTPSTDTRFADYPLEKVYSTFGPDDDETNPLTDRPLRAYSVGSRLEHSKRKFRMDHSLSSSLASNSSINSRTRAYSVGSRAKMPRSDQYKSSFSGSPAAQIALFNIVQQSQSSNMASASTQNDPNNNSKTINMKSSSVPMLDNGGPSECSDGIRASTDFMELDFSTTSMGMPISESDDYVLSDNLTPVSGSTEHDYLNMEPRNASQNVIQASQVQSEGYVEMRPVGSSFDSTSMSNSPMKSYFGSHPNSKQQKLHGTLKVNPGEEGDYLNMGGGKANHSTSSLSGTQPALPQSANEDYLNMTPGSSESGPTLTSSWQKNQSNNVPCRLTSEQSNSVEEGYLEMTFGTNRSANNPSGTDFKEQQELFIKGRRPMTTNRSLPINIKYCSPSSQDGNTPGRTGLFTKLSSLEEAQSPIPSSAKATHQAATIFPFSPVSPTIESRPTFHKQSSFGNTSSPWPAAATSNNQNTSVEGAIGQDGMGIARKCLVDGSTGTIQLSEESGNKTPERVMSVDESNDYVKFIPRDDGCRAIVRSDSNSIDDDLQGDYVLMNPASKLPSGSSNNLIQSGLTIFKPIHNGSEQPVGVALNRQLSLNAVAETETMGDRTGGSFGLMRTTSDGDGGGSVLRNTARKNLNSRPSSVNSDKITSRISNLSLNRPNSANSDRLSTISSSSSSTSTLCGGNSSSSSSTTTLCGGMGKVASSPIVMSRSTTDAPSAMDSTTGAEKELHYASLDLPPSSVSSVSLPAVAPLAIQEADFTRHTTIAKRISNPLDTSNSSSATTTPSPNVLNNSSNISTIPAFNYAQLDFAKCDLLKQKSQPPEIVE